MRPRALLRLRRGSRALRAPLGYWNELALLGDVAVPVALWLAAPRDAPAGRACSLYVAVVALLLTYSRFGVALACLAAAAWVVLDGRPRREPRRARARRRRCGGGLRRSRSPCPGSRRTGSRSVRAHDGWIFALAVLAAVLAVAGAAALARRRTAPPACAAGG